MQPKAGKTNGKRERPLVHQPFLKGRACSLLSARRGLRVFLYLAMSAGLFFFMGQFLAVETFWLRVTLNFAALSVFYTFLFRSGALSGLGDVAFAEIALSRKNADKQISRDEMNRCYHPAKGFFTAFFGAIPLLLACLVYAFLVRESTYSLGSLPAWLDVFRERADIGLALAYYGETGQLQALDFLRMIARLLIFPFVNLAGARNASALLLVERLSPFLLAIAPMMYGIGYSRGERRRALIHGSISANMKKAARQPKEKLSPREPRQLV